MPLKSRKLAVVGARSVGKSSLIVRFVEDHFLDSYYPTLENQFGKNLNIQNQDYAIEILDTAGQDENSILNEKHIVGVHGYVLVFSVTSRHSFETIQHVCNKILNSIGSDDIPMIFVGNKCDLEYQRQVDKQEGEKLAERYKCKYMEISAKDNLNINQTFESLITDIEMMHNPPVMAKGKYERCIIV